MVAGAQTAVVLNGCPLRGHWTPRATEALRSVGAEVCPATLGYRVAHARAFMAGRTAQELEPRSGAAPEVGPLYE